MTLTNQLSEIQEQLQNSEKQAEKETNSAHKVILEKLELDGKVSVLEDLLNMEKQKESKAYESLLFEYNLRSSAQFSTKKEEEAKLEALQRAEIAENKLSEQEKQITQSKMEMIWHEQQEIQTEEDLEQAKQKIEQLHQDTSIKQTDVDMLHVYYEIMDKLYEEEIIIRIQAEMRELNVIRERDLEKEQRIEFETLHKQEKERREKFEYQLIEEKELKMISMEKQNEAEQRFVEKEKEKRMVEQLLRWETYEKDQAVERATEAEQSLNAETKKRRKYERMNNSIVYENEQLKNKNMILTEQLKEERQNRRNFEVRFLAEVDSKQFMQNQYEERFNKEKEIQKQLEQQKVDSNLQKITEKEDKEFAIEQAEAADKLVAHLAKVLQKTQNELKAKTEELEYEKQMRESEQQSYGRSEDSFRLQYSE
ncbi:MAG: hypothetical protein EZS28_015859 [Streblomastix strix]|uniref:Uncharacterized protein n=1 Tax=Streblomastix strix TaxID=222440 RepID=A0A5J4W188_9EUKA|nr:MAG: hypothetical protein EZS28_015859 [Streblomastix strix]